MEQSQFVRPLTTGQLFGAAFTLYRRFFGVFYTLNLVGMIGLVIYNLTIVQNLPRSFGIFDIVYLFIFTLTTVIVNATTLVAASNAVLGRPVIIQTAFQRAFSPTVIGKLGMYSLISVVLLAAVLAPGVSLLSGVSIAISPEEAQEIAVRLMALALGTTVVLALVAITELLISPIIVLEKRSLLASLARSIALFFRNAWRIILNYGILWTIPLNLLFIGIGAATNMLVVTLFPQIGSLGQIITPSLIVSTVIGSFLYPFSNLLTVLLYYDTRARIEQYNKTVLAQEMGYEPLEEMITV